MSAEAGAERYIRIGAVPEHKMRYIPNGVDTTAFHPDKEARARLRAEWGVQDAFIWLAVGRFETAKDYPNLLTAFAQVVPQYPNSLLCIAGDGPLRGEMERMARSLGIQSQVRFPGIRRDVPQLHERCRCLCDVLLARRSPYCVAGGTRDRFAGCRHRCGR